MTRDNDTEWSNLVQQVVQFMFTAEAMNVTQHVAMERLAGDVSNVPELELSMLQLIAALGNYDEVYERTMQEFIPRAGLNSFYTLILTESTSRDTSGLLY